MRIPHIPAALVVALLVLLAPHPAWAAGTSNESMQQRVEAAIDELGGTQTGWNEITWDGGAVKLALDPAETTLSTSTRSTLTAKASPGNCASGRYCVYSAAGYRGNKLSYSVCPSTQTSFGALQGKVRSVKNARSSSTVRAYAGTNLKATIGAGKGSSNVSGISRVSCS